MTTGPKIELHLHVEGAAPPDLIRAMAREKHVDLTGLFDEAGAYRYDDFAGFLRAYDGATSVLKGPDDYARLVRAVLERSAATGVAYTEMFVSPDFCGSRDRAAWAEHVAAIEEAARAVPGIEMRAVATCIRHLGPDAARAAARCAAETAGAFVTGFGMGGDETMGRQGDFAWAFDCAREAGLGLTTHAGEFAGPESVRQALDDLRVTRIGHGVRAAEDPALIDRLAEGGIVLEVCPGSNVALGLHANVAVHPIEKLRERGVLVTVSTDDPPFFRTDMDAEYGALADAFGWDDGVFRDLNRTAARAAFCDAVTRDRLLEDLDTP
jgi:adenosine deaminase